MNYKHEAAQARLKILEMVHGAQTSHIGSNFSVVDIATVLYDTMKIDKDLKPDRDRLIWSKGWAAATAYYFLAKYGILEWDKLANFGHDNSGLLGLVERGTKGIEASTGSMGHGLPIGVGMALGAKRVNSPSRVFVVMSDGEMDCGTTWESALLAAHHKLDNLVVIVDCNRWQATGRTNDVLKTEPLDAKFRAFGWFPFSVDGHDHDALKHALHFTRYFNIGSPLVVLAHTVKGKGVSFMEDKLEWHYKNVDDESFAKAKAEIEKQL